jgi:hypothetical protein
MPKSIPKFAALRKPTMDSLATYMDMAHDATPTVDPTVTLIVDPAALAAK